MTRSSRPYADGAEVARTFQGFSVEEPIAGHYRMRLKSGGVLVGIRVWHGAPLDPDTGEEMDRGHRFQAHANGAYIDLDRVWPYCADDPITEAEYRYLTQRQEWARENAPSDPHATPHRRIDMMRAKPAF